MEIKYPVIITKSNNTDLGYIVEIIGFNEIIYGLKFNTVMNDAYHHLARLLIDCLEDELINLNDLEKINSKDFIEYPISNNQTIKTIDINIREYQLIYNQTVSQIKNTLLFDEFKIFNHSFKLLKEDTSFNNDQWFLLMDNTEIIPTSLYKQNHILFDQHDYKSLAFLILKKVYTPNNIKDFVIE